MSPRFLGCLWAAAAVALGAFGAHALQARLTPERLATWETAVRYQMYVALALQWNPPAGWRALLLGSLIFSGSLYALCLTGLRAFGAVTPLGGLLMIGGWLALAWHVWKERKTT